MTIEIRSMVAADYDAVIGLWKSTSGVGLSSADTRIAITRYLERNPGLSLVAYAGGGEGAGEGKASILAGAVLCGHDGRRGLLHHLAVRPEFRRQGLGKTLVARCLQGLAQDGIDKCHLFVFNGNKEGQSFWLRCGWKERQELVLMSRETA